MLVEKSSSLRPLSSLTGTPFKVTDSQQAFQKATPAESYRSSSLQYTQTLIRMSPIKQNDQVIEISKNTSSECIVFNAEQFANNYAYNNAHESIELRSGFFPNNSANTLSMT